jgi:hypothetical protein
MKLLVDGDEVLTRTQAFEHGPQAGRWFWALSAWGGHVGVADTFEQARAALAGAEGTAHGSGSYRYAAPFDI